MKILTSAFFAAVFCLLFSQPLAADPLTTETLGEELNARVRCDRSAERWSEAQVVRVTMDEFDFHPRHLTFRACRPYRLVLVNRGRLHHSFSAKHFFPTIFVRDRRTGETVPARFGKMEAHGGHPAQLTFFATQPGQFKLKCSHFGHSFIFGMNGMITVTR